MVKLMIIGRRAPGRSRKAGQAHLRDVHAPMVVAPPAEAGQMPAGYVQNHVFDGVYPPCADGNRHAIERDLVTELWFDDVDHMRASVQTPYYLSALKPDEPRFVDDPVVERILVREEEAKPGPPGKFKLFVFACMAGERSGWDHACDAVVAQLTASSVVRNEVLPGPFGPPFADIVIEAWFADREAAAAALDSDILAQFGNSADRSRTFAVAAEEFTTQRLRGLLSV